MTQTGREHGTVLVVVLLTGVATMILLTTTVQWATLGLRVARHAEADVWARAVARSMVDVATAAIDDVASATGQAPERPPALPVFGDVSVAWSAYAVGGDGSVDFDVTVSWRSSTSAAGGRWPRGP